MLPKKTGSAEPTHQFTVPAKVEYTTKAGNISDLTYASPKMPRLVDAPTPEFLLTEVGLIKNPLTLDQVVSIVRAAGQNAVNSYCNAYGGGYGTSHVRLASYDQEIPRSCNAITARLTATTYDERIAFNVTEIEEQGDGVRMRLQPWSSFGPHRVVARVFLYNFVPDEAERDQRPRLDAHHGTVISARCLFRNYALALDGAAIEDAVCGRTIDFDPYQAELIRGFWASVMSGMAEASRSLA